ncbi:MULTISPECIES: hypothetical protein [unclassified Microcoleus]|uniref:hypothetical protein n=1 Tax=unclassified Microcoleus TaxID=2642155 RepID=UPI0025D250F6|nr:MULTISPECIES: hypothetical protein [unclassified Microcoleus]
MAMSFNLLALTRNYSNKAISSDRTGKRERGRRREDLLFPPRPEKYNLNALQPIDILNIISEKQVCSEDFSPQKLMRTKVLTTNRIFSM